MPLEELILSHLDYYGTYHHHKESMAFTAATLYISAATAVFIKGPEVWSWGSACLVAVLLGSSCAIGFMIVGWQLYQRALAADIVMACTAVATTLLTPPAAGAGPNVLLSRYRGLPFPQILIDELNTVAQNRNLLGGSRPAAIFTLIAMLTWSVAAFLRILGVA
jgi:hypothetical protein